MKRVVLRLVLGPWTAAFADTTAQPPAAQSTLAACARIDDDPGRLACYDRLAGHVAAAPAGQAAAPPAVPPAGPGKAAASAAAPRGPAQAPGATPAAQPQESFGLYRAEHPPPPPAAQAIAARIETLGRSAGGRTTLTLEGGQLWELDEADPLLAVGVTVSIRGGTFGSFLLETPTKRLHRARRLH